MKKIATISFDGGCVGDFFLTRLLERKGIKATFYLIANRVKDLDASAYQFHEIGSHSLSHPHLTLDECGPPEAIQRQLSKSKEILEEWSGREVKNFAYPYGQVCLPVLLRAMKLYDFGRTYAIDPENAYLIPDPNFIPITAFHDKWQDVTKRILSFQIEKGKPVHLAGHGVSYADNSNAYFSFNEFIRILIGNGYEFLCNWDFFTTCSEFENKGEVNTAE